MPSTYEEREAYILRKYGADPATHMIDNGAIVPRVDPSAAAKPQDDEPGAIETGLRSALGAVPSTIGSYVGAGLGTMAGTAVAPAAGMGAVLVPGTTGLAGGVLGGIGTQMAMDELAKSNKYGKSFKDWTSRGSQQHPLAAEVGAFIPQLLSANPLKSMRILSSLAKAGPTLTRYTGEQLGHLANVGAGVGVGAGGAIAGDFDSDKPNYGLGAGTAGKALLRGAAGVLLSQPNKLGRMMSLGTFKESPETTDAWKGAAPKARDAMQRSPGEPTGAPVDAEIVGETPGKQAQDAARVSDTRRGPFLLGQGEGIGSQAETDAAMAKADAARVATEGNAPPPVETTPPPSNTPPKVQPEFAREPVVPEEQNFPPAPEPYEPNFVRPGERMAPDRGLPEGEYVPPSKPVGEMSDAEYAAQKRRAQRGGVPLEERQQPQTSNTVLGNTTDEWDKLIKDVGGRQYLSDVETGAKGLRNKEGVPLAGRAELPGEMQRALVQIAHNAGVDTGPHELAHVLANDVLKRGTSGEQKFMRKVMGGMGGEEQLAQQGGQEFVKRLVGEAGGAKQPLWRDWLSFIKARYLNNATPADYRAIVANTLRHGAGSEQYRPGAPKASTPPVIKPTNPQPTEGEKGLKKPSAVDVRTQELQRENDHSVPETRETLAKQLEVTLDPKSGKGVTLLVHNSPWMEIPPGLKEVRVPQGMAVYNPAKVSEADVIAGGRTPQYDGRLLGMSGEVKPAGVDTMVTTAKDGVPDVVSEVVDPRDKDLAIESQQRAVPGGKTRVTSAEDVVGKRIQEGEQNASQIKETVGVPRGETPGATEQVAGREAGGVQEPTSSQGQEGETRNQPLGPRETYGPDTTRKRRDPDFLMGPLRRLEKSGDPAQAQAADVFRRLFSRRDSYRGAYSDVLREIYSASPKDAREAYEAFIYRQKNQAAPPPLSTREAQSLYDNMDSTYRQIAVDQIAAGHQINARQRGVDPFGAFNTPGRETMEILTTKQGSPRYNALRDDFITENMNRGMSQRAAENAFEQYTNKIAHYSTVANKVDFGAVSLPEGGKLPTSWIDPDPMRAWTGYVDNVARGRAWHDVVNADPNAAAVFEGPGNLSANPHVTAAFNSFRNAHSMERAPWIGSPTRLINSALMGPMTRIVNAATTPFKALAYTPISEWPGLIASLKDIGDFYDKSFASGLNRPGNLTVMREVLGMHEGIANRVDQAAQLLTKGQGSEWFETLDRAASQGFGEFIAGVYKAKALAGDASAARFLNSFGSDWATRPTSELGMRVARLFQGNYDARNLPRWTTDSTAAPFLSLAKWSVEQWNNFRQFAIEPLAQHGDGAPLVRFLAAHLVGGLALAELKHVLTNKKPYIADWEELKNAPDKARAKQEIALKFGEAAQIMGMMGLPGDMLLSTLRHATGKVGGGMSFPAGEVMSDAAQRSYMAVKAIASGVPLRAVMTQYAKDIAQRDIQATQLLMRFSDRRDEQNKTRDYRMFQRLAGSNSQLPSNNIDYSRAAEHEFDAEKDAAIARPEGKELYKTAHENAHGDMFKFSKELDRLRTMSIPYFPSNPHDQMQYRRFLDATQGKEEATRRLSEWRADEILNNRKKGFISP